MATYRNVQISFWTDSKVTDDFTPEDKYFYLYLFTNPHTNLCGCYEVSIKLIANETGYNKDTIEHLIERFEKFHKVIRYSKESKEILLINWYKYNWTKSEKFLSGLDKSINEVKDDEFRHYLIEIRKGNDTVPIPYKYSMDTTVTFSFTDSEKDSLSEKDNDKPNKKKIPIIYYPNDESLNQTFRDFVEMRKQIKKPMTERAIDLAIKKLCKLSDGDNEIAIQILEQSIMNSWLGLFPLNEDKNGSNKVKSGYMDKVANRISEVDNW